MTSYLLSDHSEMKLEFNRKRCRKNADVWRLNDRLLITEEIMEEINMFLESKNNRSTAYPNQ